MVTQVTTRWISATGCGAALSAAVGYAAGALAPAAQFSSVHAAVFAVATAPPLLALMWLLLVAPATPPAAPARPAETVEHAWFGRAAAGAFVDVMAVLGLVLAAGAIADVDVSTQVLTGLLLVSGWLDLGARYVGLSRMET
jgi:hypothetical protein